MALRDEDFRRWLITFDPGKPAPHLFENATAAMLNTVAMVPAVPVPWPSQWRPVADPPSTPPADSDPLPQRDVLIVTWTAGEARALAKLMTGDNFDGWYAYRNNVASYIPKVTGDKAPFNGPNQPRYFHTLGLYFPLKIGTVSVLAFKSGLHMAYDGPAMPVVDLWRQIIGQVQPKLVITTGTGGGIGADVLLGDVAVGAGARFNLTGTLKDKPFAHTAYNSPAFDGAGIKSLATDALLKPNGDRLEQPRIPVMIVPPVANDMIVSTDIFAFDDSTNFYHLQGLGKCCDMGDATLGLAISQLGAGAPPWMAIRNASDPQIANPNNDMAAAKKEAERIYGKYQMVTTASSVVASWAATVAHFPGRAHPAMEFAVAQTVPHAASPPETAETVLLAMATASSLSRKAVPVEQVAAPAIAALEARLKSIDVPYDKSRITAYEIRFTDAIGHDHLLYSIDVSDEDAKAFMANYVISRGTIVAKFETSGS